MSDPTFSDIDFKNKMAGVRTTLNFGLNWMIDDQPKSVPFIPKNHKIIHNSEITNMLRMVTLDKFYFRW